MLVELHIENFAIIETLEVQLLSGLIAFTGETGAGKSIIVDAVETLLGGRADPTMVRQGAERAVVEGTFLIPTASTSAIQAILEREALLDEEDSASPYLTLGREIRLNGRNVARVNGRVVSTGLLRELGEYLVDIHGQSEHLSLLRVSQHLGLLDRFALTDPDSPLRQQLAAYQQTYQQLLEVNRELQELRQAEVAADRRLELLNFQVNEIESARLRPGEEVSLTQERNRLANAEGLASLVSQALTLLDEGTPEAPAVTDLLGQVMHTLSSLARLDPARQAQAEQAQIAFESLTELARDLRQYQESIEFNADRLDQVEERLALIHSLKRKYLTQSSLTPAADPIPALLQVAQRLRQELEQITHAAERLQELESQRAALLQALSQQGLALSQTRRQAAERLSRLIERELADLQMSGARFQVEFRLTPASDGLALPDGRQVAFGRQGLEEVEFLIAPNPGEGFKPLVKIASGGETSRLMLALKNVLARADPVPTLVFDEIDQGIGGRVGAIVGQKLWQLGRDHQVLCITHLPQLAAYGEQHFHVTKSLQAGRTVTLVECLEGEARLKELAQMLGRLSESTLQSAREMLQAAQAHAGSAAQPPLPHA